MDNAVKNAFGAIQASERLKRQTKAHIRKRTFDYGRDLERVRGQRRRMAGCLMTLVLILTGCLTWFLPVTRIGLDVNPSLEITVNALDRVVCLKGMNADGAVLAQQLDVAGLPYDEAMQRILISDGMDPYLDNGSMIAITVAGGTAAHSEEMLSKVVCRAYAVAEDENVLYCQVDGETLKAARASGLCVPRYLAWQHLLETNPGITAEEVAQLPKEEIRELARLKTLDNPCGE